MKTVSSFHCSLSPAIAPILSAWIIALALPASGQGVIVFNNRVSTVVVARVLMPDGTGVGRGFTAQLMLANPNGMMTALIPTTTFRTSSQAAQGYVNEVNVEVPGVAPGAPATLVLRAYNGASYESATIKGQSEPFTIATGGGVLPPADLVGLSGFTLTANASPKISAIPNQKLRIGEPSPMILFDVSDVETSADRLTVTSTSSNRALVPDGQVAFGGTGGRRELVITPAADQLGTSTIIVTVSDADGGKDSTTFEVSVFGIVVTSPPRSQTVERGANVAFNVIVASSGTGFLDYQWLRNGVAIGGATASSLALQNVQRSDAGEYRVAVSNQEASALSAAATLVVIGGPENDNFSDRIRLTGTMIVVDGSNLDASSETDEPAHGRQKATDSVWWSWKAPKYGSVTISTAGSFIDTLLAVYSGGTLPALKPIATNDDDPDGGTTSRATFIVAPDTDYHIAVDALGGVGGRIKLAVNFTEVGPPLFSEASGKNIVLSWPGIAIGFSVEAADDLTASVWTPVAVTPLIIGESFSAKVPELEEKKFYRLRGQ